MKNYAKSAMLVGQVCACLLLALDSARAGAVDVVVMAQETIPPKWINDGGRTSGICPDILAALERIEPRLHFVGYRHARSLPAMDAALERGDAAVACALQSSARRTQAARTVGKPLYVIRHRLAGRASDPAEVRSVDDLVRLKALVNAVRGSPFIGPMREAGVRFDESTGDNIVNLRKVVAGHGRFTYMNELTLLYYIRTQGLQGKLRMQPLLREGPAYFWVSKKADAAVGRMLEPALAKLEDSGELLRIVERWSRP